MFTTIPTTKTIHIKTTKTTNMVQDTSTNVMLPILLTFLSFTSSALSSFIPRDAYVSAVYSSAAYCPPYMVDKFSMKNSDCKNVTKDFQVTKIFNTEGTKDNDFAFIGVDQSREWIIGSFKGTNASLADLITDLKGFEFMKNGCASSDGSVVFPGRVHDGFCDYYKGFSDNSFAESFISLSDAHPTYRLVLTGHSLGAAAAVLMAYDITSRSPDKNISVFGYGQPRIGNYEFSVGVSAKVHDLTRVVHGGDIVAHLPVCCSILESKCSTSDSCPYHISNEYWYDNKMTDINDFKTCNGGEDNSCSKVFDVSVDDHLYYYNWEVGDHCCYDEPKP